MKQFAAVLLAVMSLTGCGSQQADTFIPSAEGDAASFEQWFDWSWERTSPMDRDWQCRAIQLDTEKFLENFHGFYVSDETIIAKYYEVCP